MAAARAAAEMARPAALVISAYPGYSKMVMVVWDSAPDEAGTMWSIPELATAAVLRALPTCAACREAPSVEVAHAACMKPASVCVVLPGYVSCGAPACLALNEARAATTAVNWDKRVCTGALNTPKTMNRLCNQCAKDRVHRDAPLFKCAACGVARYCGPACQRLHWKVHRRFCAEDAQRQTTDEEHDLDYDVFILK